GDRLDARLEEIQLAVNIACELRDARFECPQAPVVVTLELAVEQITDLIELVVRGLGRCGAVSQFAKRGGVHEHVPSYSNETLQGRARKGPARHSRTHII